MFPNLKIKEYKSGVKLHIEPYSSITLGNLCNLSKIQLPHLYNDSNKSNYVIRTLWELKWEYELMYIKQIA